MTDPIQNEDGSQPNDDAATVTPNEERATVHDSRNALIDAADTHYGHRGEPVEEGKITEDGSASNDVPTSTEEENNEPAPEPGLQTQERMHEEDDQTQQLPDELQNDPLAEFLEMDENENVFMRVKVNGKEMLMDLDKARAQIQKQESADDRLQEAAQLRGQLEERERVLNQREQDLQSRFGSGHNPDNDVQSSVQDAGISDEDLEKEASQVVAGLFTGSEDDAAKNLVGLLKKVRGAGQPAVNAEQIARQAATTAREELSAERQQKDVTAGYKQFAEDYPDIVNDAGLFNYADGVVDQLRGQHKDWSPAKIMHEAGKITREWVKSMTGESAPSTDDNTSELPNQPSEHRNRLKRRLRPMPRVRQGTQERETEERPQSARDVLSEVRQARGQPAV